MQFGDAAITELKVVHAAASKRILKEAPYVRRCVVPSGVGLNWHGRIVASLILRFCTRLMVRR
jgi:hypothetical protein